MAVAYSFLGEEDNYSHLIVELIKEQEKDESGGIVAACHDGVTTGFDWKYFRRLHMGATVWAIFADRG